jgi:hypothetical protein
VGYLVCDNCGGYYELQPGETPEDFTDECECGGKTKYFETLEGIGKDIEQTDKNNNYIRYGFCLGIFFISFLMISVGNLLAGTISISCGLPYVGQLYYEKYRTEKHLKFFIVRLQFTSVVLMFLTGGFFLIELLEFLFNNPQLSLIYGLSSIIFLVSGLYEFKTQKKYNQ